MKGQFWKIKGQFWEQQSIFRKKQIDLRKRALAALPPAPRPSGVVIFDVSRQNKISKIFLEALFFYESDILTLKFRKISPGGGGVPQNSIMNIRCTRRKRASDQKWLRRGGGGGGSEFYPVFANVINE